MRFAANFGLKFPKKISAATAFKFAFEIAPDAAVLHMLRLGHDPQRSPNTVPSVGMLRRVRFGAVRGELRTEIFEKFSRPQNFSIELARVRA